MLVITAPTISELNAILSPTELRNYNLSENTPLHFQLQNQEAIALVTGSGLLNTSISLSPLLAMEKDNIQAVLYAGLAAAFNLSVTPLRSACVIDQEIWPEYGLNDGVNVVARAYSQPLWKRDDGEQIYDSLDLTLPASIFPDIDPDDIGWFQTKSLTVAGISASFSRREQLWNTYHAQLENSEGFAAAYTCMRYGIPLVEIRVVSHKAGPRTREEKDIEGATLVLSTLLPSLKLV